MNKSEGNATMHARMPIKVLDPSSGSKALHNTGDAQKSMLHAMKVRELLPEYSNCTDGKASSSQKEWFSSAGKANTLRNQPVRIPVTGMGPHNSNRKADVSVRRQPVRITQKPLESFKRSARRRLDADYDTSILQANENIHPISRKSRYGNEVNSVGKCNNVKSIGIIKSSGKNSDNTVNKNVKRKSFLLPPNTIKNRHVRNQHPVAVNTVDSHNSREDQTVNRMKRTVNLDILQELPGNSKLLGVKNFNLSCFLTHIEESPDPTEFSPLEKFPLSAAKIALVPTETSSITSASVPEATVQNDPKATQVENSKESTNHITNSSSCGKNNKIGDVEEIQRPSVIVEAKRARSPQIIAQKADRRLSSKISIVGTPSNNKSFSPVTCSTEHRNSSCHPRMFNHVVLSPLPLVPNNISPSQFANNILIVENINGLKELCSGLENARISELPDESHAIMKTEITATELQPKITIDRQSLVDLESKLKECVTLIGKLLRTNGVKNSSSDSGIEENLLRVEFPLNRRNSVRIIAESNVEPQHVAEGEEPNVPLVGKPLSPIEASTKMKNDVEICERENHCISDQKENMEPAAILEISSVSRNLSKNNERSSEKRSSKNTELKDHSQTISESVRSDRTEPQERRRSVRLAAKQMLNKSATAEDSFVRLEKELDSENAQSNMRTPCHARTPSRGTKWGRRSERPLREYMALKSANKFLATPDPKRFNHEINSEKAEGTLTNESQIISDKILAELHDLYVETP